MEEIFPSIPEATVPHVRLGLTAIQGLILEVRRKYSRIQAGAITYGSLPPGTPERSEAGDAIVADAEDFIVVVNRLRRLVLECVPGDQTSRPFKRSFDAEIAPFEVARHHLEHLNTGVRKVTDYGQGALVGVSWHEKLGEKEARVQMFVKGIIGPGTPAVTTMHFPRERIDNVWISIAGQELNISAAHGAVKNLEGRLRQWGSSQAEKGWPVLLSYRVESSGE